MIPENGLTPDRTTFYNLDLYSRLASMIIENTYRYSTLERKKPPLEANHGQQQYF